MKPVKAVDAAFLQLETRSTPMHVGALFVPPAQATLDGDPSDHENIRVGSSHMGLGFNRRVL